LTAHSLLGASGAHRWLNCPGSFRLSQQLPHAPPSIYAATGTLAHTLIEASWKDGVSLPVGEQQLVDGHTITVDQDLIDGVNVMLDYLQVIDRGLTDIEVQVSLEHWVPNAPVLLFGTVDVQAFDPDTDFLEIIDYKNGAGVSVTPVDNPQLLYYAAGSVTPDLLSKLRGIRLTIVQPHAPGPPIKSWQLTAVDLMMWIDEVLIPGVEACTKPDAPLVPGPWCRFCPVAHGCPQLHQAAVDAARAEFDDVTIMNNDDELGLALSQALDQAERAVLWAEKLREFALYKAQQQLRIPGWGLEPTRATRQWTDDDAPIAKELQRLGIDKATIWERRVRSPAQIEKRLGRRRVAFGPLVEARSSGVKLARTTPVAEEFSDE
jgi:hypothetical protein